MPSCALCTLLIQIFNRHAANLSVSDPICKDQIRLQVVDVHLTGLRIPSNEDTLAETLKVGTNLHKVERRVARVQAPGPVRPPEPSVCGCRRRGLPRVEGL